MSKLYTEDQVRIMLSKARLQDYNDEDLYTADYLIEEQTPIELPTDEEIWNEYNSKGESYIANNFAFARGAEWMRNKIKGGNNG